MNIVREKILKNVNPYKDFTKYKDLIAFSIGADYFTYDYETDTDFEADFDEIVVTVEKDWLFDHMVKEGIEKPLEYLQNEYTWDDSIDWFYEANEVNKIVTVEFV